MSDNTSPSFALSLSLRLSFTHFRVLLVCNARAGGIPPLIHLVRNGTESVQVEAIAALANLAVNDANERTIAELGGIPPIIECARGSASELCAQAARALRNLSVLEANKEIIMECGGHEILSKLAYSDDDRISQQATRAMANLGNGVDK